MDSVLSFHFSFNFPIDVQLVDTGSYIMWSSTTEELLQSSHYQFPPILPYPGTIQSFIQKLDQVELSFWNFSFDFKTMSESPRHYKMQRLLHCLIVKKQPNSCPIFTLRPIFCLIAITLFVLIFARTNFRAFSRRTSNCAKLRKSKYQIFEGLWQVREN